MYSPPPGLGEVVALDSGDLVGRRVGVVELAIHGSVFLAEQLLDDAVVFDVVVHAVDEDEGERFDAAFRQAGADFLAALIETELLLEMAADEPLELLAKQAAKSAARSFSRISMPLENFTCHLPSCRLL